MSETKSEQKEKEKTEEKRGVLGVAIKAGRAYSSLMLAVGTFLIASSAFVTLTQQMIVPNDSILLTILIAFLGIVNIIGGLLIMAKGPKHV